jgi:hypothetical protein
MTNQYTPPPPPPQGPDGHQNGYPNPPYQPAPDQTAPYQNQPDQTAPYQTAPYQTVPYPPAPNQAGPYPPAPDQTGPYQPGPNPSEPGSGNKTLFIVLGVVAAAVIAALVAVFIWVIPAFNNQGGETPDPVAASAKATDDADAKNSAEPSADPSPTGTSADMPAGAIPLPPGWDTLQGPTDIPADGDPLFRKFVTGESSFQYLASWTQDETFGITTDPVSGVTMQQKAQGTEERDGDGIALAFAFFAEAEEGKYGKEPAKVQAGIQEIEAKFKAMPAAELPQHLVGHKCTSNFQTSTPELRQFRRAVAVVIGFTCTNARAETIQAVNLFTVTPWGTPQMMGISGHESYWAANPGLMEKLGNSYRANKWKLAG